MIRGIWDRETVAALIAISLLPVAAIWLSGAGSEGVVRILFFGLVTAIWQLVWMLGRAQSPSLSGLVTALALAVLAPEELGPLQLLLGASFGIVMAEQVFGGWGRNILNPATVALAFLGFGFPAAPWPDPGIATGWAAVPAALIAGALGIYSFRLIGGAALVMALGYFADAGPGEATTAALVVLVLLVCDPVASPATDPGRWLGGALYGGIVILGNAIWTAAAPVQIAVSAALITSIVAPAFDEAALAIWQHARRRRFG